MAKINEYPQASNLNNDDLFVIDQTSGGDHATKSATMAQISQKATGALQTQIGDLSTLTTSVTSSLVGAVNEVNGKVTVIDVIPNITMLNNYTLANSRLIKVGQMLVGILEISRSTAFVNNEAMATLPYYDSNFNIIIPSFCSTTDRWNAITPCNVFINNSNGNLIYAGANSNVKFVRVPIAIALP